MQHIKTIFRASLVGSLIMSLAMVGFCSRPVVAVSYHACGKAASCETKIRTCCCPNCNGRCGGVCCKQNGSKPAPSPLSGRTASGKHNPVVLVVQVGSAADGCGEAGGPCRDASAFRGLPAALSLQSQHVRIQT